MGLTIKRERWYIQHDSSPPATSNEEGLGTGLWTTILANNQV